MVFTMLRYHVLCGRILPCRIIEVSMSKLMRPIRLRDKREIFWTKQWLRGQLADGRLSDIRYQTIEAIESEDDVQRVLSRILDSSGRQRLQKALSARRSRDKQSSSTLKASNSVRGVTTELTAEARDMLRVVAASRGVTTSQLLISKLEDEYYKMCR